MSCRTKDIVRTWSDMTFQCAFERSHAQFGQSVVSAVNKILSEKQFFNIANRKIEGWAFENLPKTEERGGFQIRYSDAYHGISNEPCFDPVLYMLVLTERVRQKYPEGLKNVAKLAGFLGRSMRTFQSLLRETPFGEELKQDLETHDHVLIHQSGNEDAVEHTDIKITFRAQTYRVWIYQLTTNGLPHDIDRVAGRRGELPKGIHILCPLKSEPAETGSNSRPNKQKEGPIKKMETTEPRGQKPTNKGIH